MPEPRVQCPKCEGTGKYLGPGTAHHPAPPCPDCNGTGQVEPAPTPPPDVSSHIASSEASSPPDTAPTEETFPNDAPGMAEGAAPKPKISESAPTEERTISVYDCPVHGITQLIGGFIQDLPYECKWCRAEGVEQELMPFRVHVHPSQPCNQEKERLRESRELWRNAAKIGAKLENDARAELQRVKKERDNAEARVRMLRERSGPRRVEEAEARITDLERQLEEARRGNLHAPALEKGTAALRVSLDPEAFVYGNATAIKLAQEKLLDAERRAAASLYARAEAAEARLQALAEGLRLELEWELAQDSLHALIEQVCASRNRLRATLSRLSSPAQQANPSPSKSVQGLGDGEAEGESS